MTKDDYRRYRQLAKGPAHCGLDSKWLTELTPRERNTLIATFGGWALDGMDVMAYSFVIPTLMTTWHITGGEYVQPDCNLPTEAGWKKQLEVGREYFHDRFGVVSTIGYNVDQAITANAHGQPGVAYRAMVKAPLELLRVRPSLAWAELRAAAAGGLAALRALSGRSPPRP